MFQNSAATAAKPLEVQDYHSATPVEEYDVNFVFPLDSQLASNGVILVPCIASYPSCILADIFLTLYDYSSPLFTP